MDKYLFDNDAFDDDELDSDEVFNAMRSNLLYDWKNKILSIPAYLEKERWTTSNIRHNLCKIIDDTDTITMEFDGSLKSNSIICPIEFITGCPKAITLFNINNYVPESKVDIILYSRVWYDENDELKEKLITSDDIDIISNIKFPENSNIQVGSIIIKGSFDKLDTFYKFINSFKQLNNVNFFIHYDSKIYGVNCKKNRNRICDLMHDGILNVDETFPLVSYTGFINNCMIPELENKKE